MSEPTDDLEALIRRPGARGGEAPRPKAADRFLGQCACGARISSTDVYSQGGEADLGRPSRRIPTARLYRYRCPLCGQTGELAAEGAL